MVLDLPFPRSINFSGRPLKVIFGEKALKHTGLMPTNFILEYRVDDASKVRLKCDSSEMHCAPSPHCPPGVLRYYFGVGPETKDPKALQMHAVKFFNFLLATVFPNLAQRYELKEIEHSDYEMPGAGGGRTYPSSLETTHDRLLLLPAVLRGDSPAPRLLPRHWWTANRAESLFPPTMGQTVNFNVPDVPGPALTWAGPLFLNSKY